LKGGDALTPPLFNFAFEETIRKVQERQEVLICVGHISFCFLVDDINFFEKEYKHCTKAKDILFLMEGLIQNQLLRKRSICLRHDTIKHNE
jgi:hypothetical protein